jgi:hypothetical protein
MSDIFSIKELTDIYMLNIIGQCDVKHIMTSPIKSETSELKVLTYSITSILVIMSVSTFKTYVIL